MTDPQDQPILLAASFLVNHHVQLGAATRLWYRSQRLKEDINLHDSLQCLC
jgi:hypothetical protein